MKNFSESLQEASHLSLKFTLRGRPFVPSDFHVTEVKKVTTEAMDCGGKSDSWQELVIQLWSPKGEKDATPMTARKFLDIVEVTGYQALLDTLPLRFEYGDARLPAVQYHLHQIIQTDTHLEIELKPPAVACKPRAAGDLNSCC